MLGHGEQQIQFLHCDGHEVGVAGSVGLQQIELTASRAVMENTHTCARAYLLALVCECHSQLWEALRQRQPAPTSAAAELQDASTGERCAQLRLENAQQYMGSRPGLTTRGASGAVFNDDGAAHSRGCARVAGARAGCQECSSTARATSPGIQRTTPAVEEIRMRVPTLPQPPGERAASRGETGERAKEEQILGGNTKKVRAPFSRPGSSSDEFDLNYIGSLHHTRAYAMAPTGRRHDEVDDLEEEESFEDDPGSSPAQDSARKRNRNVVAVASPPRRARE